MTTPLRTPIGFAVYERVHDHAAGELLELLLTDSSVAALISASKSSQRIRDAVGELLGALVAARGAR